MVYSKHENGSFFLEWSFQVGNIGQRLYRNNVKLNADGTNVVVFNGSEVQVFERTNSTDENLYLSFGTGLLAPPFADFDIDSVGATMIVGNNGYVDVWTRDEISGNWNKTEPPIKTSVVPSPLYFGRQVSISGDVSAVRVVASSCARICSTNFRLLARVSNTFRD